MMHVDQKGAPVPVSNNVQNGGITLAEHINFAYKKIQDDLAMLGRKVQQHEENLIFLKNQENLVEKSILHFPVGPSMSKASFEPLNGDGDGEASSSEKNEEKIIIERILLHEKSAAALLYRNLKNHHSNQAANVTWTKDVLGIVATLGRIQDANLSRLLSEYLGIDSMMAIVCKTYEGVRALETYDPETNLIKGSGLSDLVTSNGMAVDGRFLVICLENLRPYTGNIVLNDPQKRLDLETPRLSDGTCPPGFLGYAVNMINIESKNLYYLTSSGLGLRETLFYHIFPRLQVYQTRSEMLLALPSIRDGAVSLDGGIIKATGVFSFGNRQDVDVIFPKSCGTVSEPFEYYENDFKMRELQWKKDKISEDIRRQGSILEHSKVAFAAKKQELLQFLAQSSSHLSHAVG